MRTFGKSGLVLSSVETFQRPFPYFVSSQAFNEATSHRILTWLELQAPWKLVQASFYDQYEFSAEDAELPSHLAFLRQGSFMDHIRAKTESLFQTRLSSRVDLTAHRLVPGQRIRIHNDFIPGQESHRLLIQLNRCWTSDDGGFLLLFNSGDPSDIHKVFRPAHNSMLGFAITPSSHHAVSTVHRGERFTLVYSFYRDDC